MKQSEVFRLLKSTGIPTTYAEWPQGERAVFPNIVFIHSGYGQFMADNFMYFTVNRWDIELYTARKDPEAEERLLHMLNENKIIWSKINETRINEELYQVVYTI